MVAYVFWLPAAFLGGFCGLAGGALAGKRQENLTVNRPSSLLILAGFLSFCAAIFQAVIALVPAWSDAFGAGDVLVSNPALLLTSGLLVALLLVIFGLYGLSVYGGSCTPNGMTILEACQEVGIARSTFLYGHRTNVLLYLSWYLTRSALSPLASGAMTGNFFTQ
jgi:hypothetical protein